VLWLVGTQTIGGKKLKPVIFFTNNGTVTTIKMSSSLVKIVNKRLTLSGTLRIPENDNIRIISILGKARMGKSTFLNSIVYWLQGDTEAAKGEFTPPFATQDDDNHCTRGIDYYYSKSKSILLLDCQGLALEDSSHDPMLLLFTYLISDRIIFNERMMLQNEALKLMEPICAFMNYIETDDFEKPRLFFRISDSNNMSTDPAINLKKVMARYNDQYQSIRDSVAHLFQPDIGIIKTDMLDRKTKAAVQNGSYAELFEEEGLGFTKAVETLFADLPKGRPAKAWLKEVPKYVENINNNEKITIDKLDVVTMNAQLEILNWNKDNIPPELFTPIIVDGLQATYDLKVEPRKAAKQKYLNAFTRRFKTIADSIKDKYYKELNDQLSAPIKEAERMSEELAEAGLKQHVINAKADRQFSIDNTSSYFTHQNQAWIKGHFGGFTTLRSAMERYVEPVRTKYESWMKTQEAEFNRFLSVCQESETTQLEQMKEWCSQVEESYLDDATEMIEKMERIPYQGRNNVGMVTVPTPWIVNHVKDVMKEKARIGVNFTPLKINVAFKSGNLIATIEKLPEVKGEPTHELFKPVWDASNAGIADFMKDGNNFAEIVMARKEEILMGKWFVDINYPVHNVPEIQFIHIGNFGPFTNCARTMSLKTYQASYESIMRDVRDTLYKEGMLRDHTDIMLRQNSGGPANLKIINVEYAEDFLGPLFCQAFAKTCALRRVKDENFPEKTELSTVV
jgi:hypothetical protein